MIDTTKFVEESKKVLNSVTETISACASAGKQKIDIFTLESELSRAQKQLGHWFIAFIKPIRRTASSHSSIWIR